MPTAAVTAMTEAAGKARAVSRFGRLIPAPVKPRPCPEKRKEGEASPVTNEDGTAVS